MKRNIRISIVALILCGVVLGASATPVMAHCYGDDVDYSGPYGEGGHVYHGPHHDVDHDGSYHHDSSCKCVSSGSFEHHDYDAPLIDIL